jgi:hypothetical protein
MVWKSSARRHVHADAKRRLSLARERSREDAPRDRASFALDAEAYDEYGKAMIEMAHFVKPIMSMTPPDPHLAESKRSGRISLFWVVDFKNFPTKTSTTRCS